MAKSKYNKKILDTIAKRAHYYATQMIHLANNRKDKEKGDPKIGGHPAACASCLHILGALHLYVKSGFDHMAIKPHASPNDHSYNYLLDLFFDKTGEKLSLEDAKVAMRGLRAFSKNGEPVFQSYHSHYDPDHHNFLPSGTVGIPPVNLGYLALAYRYAKDHGYEVPEQAHFWALIGDSEFREGSLFEAIPDFAERELGNLTWIIDFNRQSLDGHRITNTDIFDGSDSKRIAETAVANGWEVIQVQHGKFRESLFKKDGGKEFKTFLEKEIEDYELQALLLSKDMKAIRKRLLDLHPKLKTFLNGIDDKELLDGIHDMGGHDFDVLIEAMEKSKENKKKPTMIIAHTIKGWGLEMAAIAGNHSYLPDKKEVDELRKAQNINEDDLFEKFNNSTEEYKYLKKRGEKLYKDIQKQWDLKNKNRLHFVERVVQDDGFPTTMDINLKMASYPHTQWMFGQLTSKLTRIANTPTDSSKLLEGQKALSPDEEKIKCVGELLVAMAPDVGTTTNLNPTMDGKVYSSDETEDYVADLQVQDAKSPDLVPGAEKNDRYIRFEIAEANTMSCAGSFGQMRDLLGIPLLPLMTVYDFFIKRALDQYFYNLYWRSSFMVVGTPSGVTLSPEGAQHGWKSDFQIPNQITWEPFFCQELDWIFTDALRAHFLENNQSKNGVLVRGSTRGIDQKLFLKHLKKQWRFKDGRDENLILSPTDVEINGATQENQINSISEEEILDSVRQDVLKGGYYLIDYRNYAGYEPGDNVVHIFSMGALGTEAIEASEKLLEKGIYANVIVVTSPDLLIGNLADEDGYHHLKQNLDVNANLHLQPLANGSADGADIVTLAGRRIPIVSVHDGEPGLLDNIGSIIGTRHEALAVRRHSKCGRPSEVYEFHEIDADSIVETVGKVLSETALEEVRVSQKAFTHQPSPISNWRELWPEMKEED